MTSINAEICTYQFHLVANMPYGGVGKHSIEDAISTHQASCSTKHLLLARLLNAIGIETRFYMGPCDLRTLNDYLPDKLKQTQRVIDFHNFLKAKIDGTWLTLDATFGINEIGKGLPSNVGWDASQDFKILFPVSHSYPINDIFSAKHKALAKLSDEQKLRRNSFFRTLTQYLDPA